MTVVLPDPAADPAGYVLAKAAEVETAAESIAGESPMLAAFVLAQVALWRGVLKRHWPGTGDPGGQGCVRCGWVWPCPDLTDVVAACQAYAGGA